jgi:hypothetical protein
MLLDALNRWAAVHRLDAAHLFRLALEQGSAGARYHAVAEEGMPVREIAGFRGKKSRSWPLLERSLVNPFTKRSNAALASAMTLGSIGGTPNDNDNDQDDIIAGQVCR